MEVGERQKCCERLVENVKLLGQTSQPAETDERETYSVAIKHLCIFLKNAGDIAWSATGQAVTVN